MSVDNWQQDHDLAPNCSGGDPERLEEFAVRVNRGAAIALAFHLDEIRHGWTEAAGCSFVRS